MHIHALLSNINTMSTAKIVLAQIVPVYFFGTTAGQLIGLPIYDWWLRRKGQMVDPKYSAPKTLANVIAIFTSGILWAVIWALGASHTVSTNWYWVLFASMFSYIFIKSVTYWVFSRVVAVKAQKAKLEEIEKNKQS